MSALPPKADIAECGRRVRLVRTICGQKTNRFTRCTAGGALGAKGERVRHERSGPLISRVSIGDVELPMTAPTVRYFVAIRSRYQTELSFRRANRLRLRSNFAPRYGLASRPKLAWVGPVH
jgi:hypothetical protein